MKESIIKYILLLTLVQVGHHAAGADIVDTAFINSLLRHGRSLHYTDPDSALYYYRLIIEDKRQKDIKPDPGLDGLAKAYLGTVIRAQDYSGDIYYYNDEYKRAESYYQSSLDIARAGGFNEFTANSVYNVGYIHYVTNNYDRAAELFMESYHIFSETENDQGMFDAIQACALAQRHLGNQELADSCYRKAFDLAGIIGDSLQVADVRLNNGILLCEQGNLEEGTRYFEEALRYYENHGDNEAVSLALLNIGVVMKMIGEYEKAESYIKRSANISETLQQKSQLVVRYYNLADLYMEMGKLETAFDYCQKTMEVAGEIGTRPFNTECNLLLGKYYYQLAEYNQAESYFRSAADSVKNSSDKPLMAHVQLWYARNCLKSGRPARAIELAEESVRLSDDHQLLMNRKEAALVLSQAYEKSGDPLSALRWFKLFREYSDSLNVHQQHQEIRRIEARYNFQEKESENELLRNRASLQEQQLRNRNVVTIALVSIVLLSVVIILLLYKRSRDAKLLYQQQQLLSVRHLEELEQQLDGKNRELTSKTMFLNQKNDLITRLISRLQEIRDTSDNSSDEIVSIVNELRADSPQSNWKEFEAQFIQVHPGFYQRLYELHPQLTSYEQRMCAFLRMNLNTKEIASITGRSTKSIEVTRSRIRSKLNLSRHDNLSSFLAAI